MISDRAPISKRTALYLPPSGTIALTGEMLANRHVTTDTDFVGLQKRWVPTGEPSHGLKIHGIEIAPYDRYFFTARPIFLNTSECESYEVGRVYACVYEGNNEDEIDFRRGCDFVWPNKVGSEWIAPETGGKPTDPVILSYRTKAIQFIGMSLRSNPNQARGELVPLEAVLHQRSPYGANPDWAQLRVRVPN